MYIQKRERERERHGRLSVISEGKKSIKTKKKYNKNQIKNKCRSIKKIKKPFINCSQNECGSFHRELGYTAFDATLKCTPYALEIIVKRGKKYYSNERILIKEN